MIRGFAFLALFALTNASLVLLVPFTPRRFLTAAVLYGTGTAVMMFVLFDPRSRWLGRSQTGVPTSGRHSVALTFDDGPCPEVTPQVLQILREKQVPATFFVIGERVERHPGLVRLASREGHVIGNHTYSHPPLFCFLTPNRLRDEIVRAQHVIAGAIGAAPRHFRSPVGLRHLLLETTLDRAALRFVLWRLRSYDTKAVTSEGLRRRIVEQVSPGAIVLLHDRPGPGAAAMLDALPAIIDTLRERGYEFVTVDGGAPGAPGGAA